MGVFCHYISTLPSHRPISFLSHFKREAFKIISALSSDVHPILKGFNLIISCKNNFFLSPFFAIPTVTSATVITHFVHLLQTSVKHTSCWEEKWILAGTKWFKSHPKYCALPLCDHRATCGRAVSHLWLTAWLGTTATQNPVAMFYLWRHFLLFSEVKMKWKRHTQIKQNTWQRGRMEWSHKFDKSREKLDKSAYNLTLGKKMLSLLIR